ncbi:hypothetical protein P8452_42869 [Trifolium repens]|nr:hypothetical protein P8452_42869 [Trifolium repens]
MCRKHGAVARISFHDRGVFETGERYGRYLQSSSKPKLLEYYLVPSMRKFEVMAARRGQVNPSILDYLLARK